MFNLNTRSDINVCLIGKVLIRATLQAHSMKVTHSGWVVGNRLVKGTKPSHNKPRHVSRIHLVQEKYTNTICETRHKSRPTSSF